MAKKNKEPEFIRSALNTPMINYRVYYMNKSEKLKNFLLSFVLGGAAGLIFYGGQFRDSEGLPTTATMIGNVVIFVVVGLIISKIFMPIRNKQLKDKRKRELTSQFRELLSAVSTSLSGGMNMQESLASAHEDLKLQYSANAYIVKETEEMLNGMKNNILLEEMLLSLGERSEIDDIRNFGIVFSMCFRTGGNLKDIVRRTNNIISEKIEISEEIETAIASNKMQFSCMMVIPFVIVIMLRTMSSSFAASFATPVGIAGMTIAIIIFLIAYKLGQKIMDVKG